ncbi:MAG: 3-hydroxyacyl-ACP dehydratase FabZ [Endomicrobiales bacterium]|nr:3-hydroxyacyl-ACP dehydratase FabZ [Endomicrobiales bacterium]
MSHQDQKNGQFFSCDVKKVLPQKYPFVFIDRVVEFDKTGSSITCLKHITANEDYFQGHFPENPIMPGVIIIEAMAQAGILLYAHVKSDNMKKNPQFFLGKVEAVFKRPAVPGDTLVIEASADKVIDTGGIVKVRAKVGEDIIAEAVLGFGVKLGQ